MKNYVIDASVILSFLMEKGFRKASFIESLLKDAESGGVKLLSSPILPLEVGNGLRFTLKNQEQAEDVYRRFLKLPVEYLPLTEIQLKKVLSLSYLLKTTAYDTSYHLLAQVRDAKYITCDIKYYRKAKKLGNIELLD